MILLTVFLRLQNKKCDNFFFYVIGTNRDFPIIDVLYTNCVHLFIDLRTKNDFLHFFGSRDFFFCVARNSAWSRAAFENRHYKLISRHFELFYNEHMCLVMNAHTHTQCRTSLASRHSVFNDRDKKKWERQTKFSLWKMIRKRNSEIQQMFRWYHTCTLDFIDVKITKEEVKWKNSMLGANGFRLFFTICQIKWFWCSMNLNLYRFEQLQSGFRECRWDFNFQQANDSWQSHVHI